MTKRQEIKQSMYLVTNEYLLENESILSSFPGFTNSFGLFQTNVTQIQLCSKAQLFNSTKGTTTNKKQLKEALITLVADAKRRLTAFARFTNDQVLLNKIGISESELRRYTDNELKEFSQGVYDRAQENIDKLGEYGVTAATQADLQNAITAFGDSIPSTRLAVTESSQNTALLESYFVGADAALDNIDVIVEMVKVSHLNFYNGYKIARKLVSTSSGSLVMRGFVTDASTGVPIKGATLTLSLNGEIKLAKKTADKGGYNIKSLEDGVYSVTISKTGYKDKTLNVTITQEELVELDVELEKS